MGDEQDRFDCFPSSNRTEKVPPGGCGVAPCKQSPRIMIYYAPIATASRQARQARRRRSPCRRSAMLCPLCCFWRSALPEHGAETIAYNQSAKESNENKPTRQKAKEKGKPVNIIQYTHTKAREKKGYTIIPCYKIAMLISYTNKYI